MQGFKGGIQYQFDTSTTDSDPGAGKFRYNNATVASVTLIYISTLDIYSNDNTVLLASLTSNPGYLVISADSNTNSTVNVFKVASETTATGYNKVSVTFEGGTTLPTASLPMAMS